MIEQHIDIPTPDGAMNAFVTRPEEGAPFPVVVFYMDAPGKREELHGMARRIAATGYCVVLPNLYYRTARDFEMEWSDAGIDRMRVHMNAIDMATVMRDTRAILDWLEPQPGIDTRRVAALGYCMSGKFAIGACAAFPGQFRCAASYYGVALASERADSPHRLTDAIRGEVYIACAEHDQHVAREEIDALAAALARSGVRHRVEWYLGADHGFAFPERPGVFDRDAAERHWERLFALLRRNLAD